jgi:CheY-like chemotaxis protein
VLVVDDNADSAATVADLLAMAGCEAVTAQDGASVSERVRAFQPEVVLLDIGLPDISGYEVARQIRAMEGVRQPVLIALTGWGQAQDRQMAAEAGFDQHWIKPVDPQRLMDLASSLDALDSTGHT